MIIIIMNKDVPILRVEKDRMKISSQWIGDKNSLNLSKTFIAKCRKIFPENISIENFNDFLESRCIDKRRKDMDYWLRYYDIPSYNPFWICKKTHGSIPTDFIWMKFDDEKLVFSDVKFG